jgi:hypothetical protein
LVAEVGGVIVQMAKVRPFFASAILRGIDFSQISYASFIDLQVRLGCLGKSHMRLD